jgi:diguanylate cyclase (GGDEF)-like protein
MRALRALLALMGIVVIAGNFTGGGQIIRSVALAVAAAVTLARVLLVKEERLVWAVCAVALAGWTGQLYYIIVPNAPVTFPALPDYMALIFYAGALVSMVLLITSRLRGRRNSLWLDGVIGGLAVSALMSLFVFRTALTGSGVETQIVNGQLGYAISDLFILGFLAAIALLGRWRLGLGGWGFIGAFALLAVGDSLYVSAVADNQLLPTGLVSSLWALGPLTLAATATSRRRVARAGNAAGFVPVALLGVSAMSALCLLLAYQTGLAGETPALTALAAAVLGMTVVRFCVTMRENSRMLEESRTHALTDSLTGLPNRRRLMDDLANAIGDASKAEPLTLALFDLDGFKSYNDTFGHPAGDQLLVRLGRKLAAAVAGHGIAYRLGGDEFFAVVEGTPNDAERVVTLARVSLAERGDHFSVTASCGSVLIPDESDGVEGALQMADQRMYGAKDRRTSSAGRQASDVLLKVLHERQPGLDEYGQSVTEMARAVALRAGIHGERLDEVTRAAELHDIGKIAIPEAILNKPGPLSEEEWEFMHRHTLLGERILGVAPALRPIAELVRSSHERWDGKGYPDRLQGDEVPIGCRIICVCDAFSAMTQDRPYRASLTSEEAIAELRRCAGSQFDPSIVALFCEVLECGTPPHAPVEDRLAAG